jgi:hypothetical protein
MEPKGTPLRSSFAPTSSHAASPDRCAGNLSRETAALEHKVREALATVELRIGPSLPPFPGDEDPSEINDREDRFGFDQSQRVRGPIGRISFVTSRVLNACVSLGTIALLLLQGPIRDTATNREQPIAAGLLFAPDYDVSSWESLSHVGLSSAERLQLYVALFDGAPKQRTGNSK